MEQQASKTPGKLLTEAREAAKLSREDIAAQLHLKVSVIDDLENDHYPPSVNLVFIKGYLCAYGKIVGVAAASLLQAFAQLGVDVSSAPGAERAVRPSAVNGLGAKALGALRRVWAAGAALMTSDNQGWRVMLRVAVVLVVVVLLGVRLLPHRHGAGKPTVKPPVVPAQPARTAPTPAKPSNSDLSMDFAND